MSTGDGGLLECLEATFSGLEDALGRQRPKLTVREVGRVLRVGKGTAIVDGLPGTQSEELLRFSSGRLGMAFNLDPGRIGVVMLDSVKT